MENISNWVASNPLLTVGAAGFLCGVVLLYFLMMRGISHREKTNSES